MRRLWLVILPFTWLWLFAWPPPNSWAQQANKFGIHVLETPDLALAQELVNSSGGDWGWVTVVIRDDQLDQDYWQAFFDQSRERHLIPLVRIATHLEGPYWARPQPGEATRWATFLNSLNWPTSERYVIVFNEPNQAKEWGNTVNPAEYAEVLSRFAQVFHATSRKFKVLNAGLDLAAANTRETREAFNFLSLMNQARPGIFDQLDGWVSHSYPNHGYRGRPWDNGKTSIRGYQWELNFLKKNLQISKGLPVFITETGWPKRSNNRVNNNNYHDTDTVAEYTKAAFENVWLKDDRVKAVTPFLLNYPGALFADFAWVDQNRRPYPQYETTRKMAKNFVWPQQETKYAVQISQLPPFLPAETEFRGRLTLTNLGESILGERENFVATASVTGLTVNPIQLTNRTLKPQQSTVLELTVSSSTTAGVGEFYFTDGERYRIKVFPASWLAKARYSLWERVIRSVPLFFKRRFAKIL